MFHRIRLPKVAIALLVLAACARDMNPQKGAHEFTDHGDSSSSQKAQIADALTTGTWCVVQDTEKSDSKSEVVAYRFSKDHSVAYVSPKADLEPKDTWNFANGLLTIRHEDGTQSEAKLEDVRFTPPGGSEQDCLKSTFPDEPGVQSIVCKCEIK